MKCIRTVVLLCVIAFFGCKGCDSENDKRTRPDAGDSDVATDANNLADGCVAETDEDFCARVEAECGDVTADDNCGTERTAACGECADGESCGDDNTCGCQAESDEEFCARLMKDCGTLEDTDNCGEARSAECGTCVDPEQCGAMGTDNVCGCPCNIDGTCVPAGMANPDNTCEVCEPALSDTAWSAAGAGTSCDDGLTCTAEGACDGAGACVPGVLQPDACFIAGACVADGDANPANPCEWCDPLASDADWSANDGAVCDDADGLDCTGVCQGGTCGSEPRPGTCLVDGTCYADGDLNSAALCEQCLSDLDRTQWSQAIVGTACDDGLACTPNSACGEFGDCEPGPPSSGTCALDGACYNDAAINPSNPCQVCDAADPLAWSGVASGTSCDDGLVCTGNDACDGAGACVGDASAGFCAVDQTCVPDGTVNPNNPCEVCDAATSTTAWTPIVIGTTCDAGLACASGGTCDGLGACVPDTIDAGYCVIENICFMDGDPNPDDDCGFCDSTTSPTAWANNDGAICTDGDGLDCTGLCFAGVCQALPRPGTCAVDNDCWMDGDTNPANVCEQCDAAAPTVWSGAPQGTTCDDGASCTANDQCDGAGACVGDVNATCAIGGACYPAGTPNPANPCQACDPVRDPFSWTPVPAGSACDDGETCTINDTCDGRHKCEGELQAGFCFIRGVCYADGDPRPDIPNCQACDVAVDIFDWSIGPAGVSCDDGLGCTTDSTCNNGGQCKDGQPMPGSCAIDGACWADGDTNPLNLCQMCDSSIDGEVWSGSAAGTVCADGLDCTRMDACDGAGFCVGMVDADTCAIDGACYADGEASPGNTCRSCDADVDPRNWSLAAPGSVCDDSLSCTSAETCDAAGECLGTQDPNTCLLDGACYGDGDANPLNICQACDVAWDNTKWRDRDGTACDDMDALDCTGVCVDGACSAGAVVGGSCALDNACWMDGAINTANECEVCDADASQRVWSNVADDTPCANGVCCMGACQATCP